MLFDLKPHHDIKSIYQVGYYIVFLGEMNAPPLINYYNNVPSLMLLV